MPYLLIKIIKFLLKFFNCLKETRLLSYLSPIFVNLAYNHRTVSLTSFLCASYLGEAVGLNLSNLYPKEVPVLPKTLDIHGI